MWNSPRLWTGWDQVCVPLGLAVSRWPIGSCFSERRLVRAAHGKGRGGTQLLAAAEEEPDTLQRYQGAKEIPSLGMRQYWLKIFLVLVC